MASANIVILAVSALLFSSVLSLYLPTAACARHDAVLNPKDGLNSAGGLHHVVVSGAGKAGPVTDAGGGSGPTTAEMRADDAAAEMQGLLEMDYDRTWRKRLPRTPPSRSK
ncbi:hypothetical protein ACQJBY_035934 [Aegilops geniculata]